MKPLKRATLVVPSDRGNVPQAEIEKFPFEHQETLFFTVRVAEHLHRKTMKMIESPSCGIFKASSIWSQTSRSSWSCCSRKYLMFYILSEIEFVLCLCFQVICCSRTMDAMLENNLIIKKHKIN